MSIVFEKEVIDGAWLISNHQYKDDRGVYEKNFEYNTFLENGIDFSITESSDLYTNKGSIRGIHFQLGSGQQKLIRVIKGKIYDVIVDIRKDSVNYLKHFSITLSDKDNYSLYIPNYYAHGFLALEDSIFSYHCSGKYEPEKCGGLRWNDPKLGIKWPLGEYGINKLLITEKDGNWNLV